MKADEEDVRYRQIKKRREVHGVAIEISGNTIQIPQGDTGTVKFVAEKGEVTSADKGVFTLAQRSGMAILRKVLLPDMSDNTFHMPFVYDDTAKLRPDNYEWSFRVVRGGTFDASGKLMNVQGQHTAVLKGRLHVLALAGGAR